MADPQGEPGHDLPDGWRANWTIVTELLGAVAGFVVVLYFVGGLMFWARLMALDLPAYSGVSLLPSSALLVAGLRALKVGVIVALAVSILSVLAHRLDAYLAPWLESRPNAHRWLRRVVPAVLAVTLVAPVLKDISFAELETIDQIVIAIAGLMVLVLAFWVLHSWAARPLVRSLRFRVYVLCSAAVLLAALLHFFESIRPPSHLSFATVRMKSGAVTDGYFIAASSSGVYLAPQVGTRVTGVVTELPRGDIATLSIVDHVPAAQPRREHRVQAQLGSHPFQPQTMGSGDEVLDWLANVRTDPNWTYPPVLPTAAAAFVVRHREEYDGSQQRAGGGTLAGVDEVRLRTLLERPQLFAGRELVTTGQAAEVVVRWRTATRLAQTVVLRPRGEGASEATCDTVVPLRDAARFGQSVDVRGTPVAWGTVKGREGRSTTRLVLACASTVRRAPR